MSWQRRRRYENSDTGFQNSGWERIKVFLAFSWRIVTSLATGRAVEKH